MFVFVRCWWRSIPKVCSILFVVVGCTVVVNARDLHSYALGGVVVVGDHAFETYLDRFVFTVHGG